MGDDADTRISTFRGRRHAQMVREEPVVTTDVAAEVDATVIPLPVPAGIAPRPTFVEGPTIPLCW
jgi:hypothetical protein